jgi:hypothetical protein
LEAQKVLRNMSACHVKVRLCVRVRACECGDFVVAQAARMIKAKFPQSKVGISLNTVVRACQHFDESV